MARTQIRATQITDGELTDADIAAANKDGAVGTASMRTLGTGATQAAAGNDARFVTNGNSHDHDGGDGAAIPTGGISAGAVTTAKLAVVETCHVHREAVQTIATATWTALQFDNERFDTNAIHDNVTNNTRLTAKVAGVYSIWGGVAWAPGASSSRYVQIMKNGATTIAIVRAFAVHVAFFETISAIAYLAINDYVELCVYQDTGGNLDVSHANEYSPEFAMAYLGRIA